jgi:hypothetical protein
MEALSRGGRGITGPSAMAESRWEKLLRNHAGLDRNSSGECSPAGLVNVTLNQGGLPMPALRTIPTSRVPHFSANMIHRRERSLAV